MSLEKIKEKVKKTDIRLLGQIDVTDKDYYELKKYTKEKLKNLNSNIDYTFDILISITLVQVAIREYKDGNYWDCFLEIFPETSSTQRNLLCNIFYKTMKFYKLYTIENENENNKRNQYVENIKAHTFVPNNYLNDYLEFLFYFYDRNLMRCVSNDLREDVEDLQEYLESTLNESSDSLKEDLSDSKNAKSYKLLKATKIVMSKLESDYICELIKPHLEYIDDFYFDNKLPVQEDRFKIAVRNWVEIDSKRFANKEKRKRKGNKGHISRKPHYHLLENKLELIIPEQKFRNEDFEDKVNLIQEEQIVRELEVYKGFGDIYISEETKIRADNIFECITIKIKSKTEKEYVLNQKQYKIFDEDKDEIEKLQLGYVYLVVPINAEVNFENCENHYINEIKDIANVYYIKCEEDTVIYVNNVPLSVLGEFSEVTRFDERNEYRICDMYEKNIQTTYRHPIISFVVDKNVFEKTLIRFNDEKLNINNLNIASTFEIMQKPNKIGVSIDLDNVIVEKDGYYTITLDEPGKISKILEEYLLITKLRCFLDKRRYIFCEEAKIYITEGYRVMPLNLRMNEIGEYIVNLQEIDESAKFHIEIDGKLYKMIVPINVFKFGFNGAFDVRKYEYIWHTQISNRLNIVLPGATNAYVYLNNDTLDGVNGELINGIFNFDISKLIVKIQSNNRAWNDLKIKYFDNKERKLLLTQILKTLWIDRFELFEDDGEINIYTEFKGNAELFVKIIEFNTKKIIVARKELISGKSNSFPELDRESLYNIELYSAESDEFGFSTIEEVKLLKTINKIGIVDENNISNCRIQIDRIFCGDTELKLNYKYTIRDLYKLDKDNIYIGKITGKLEDKTIKTREETIFQRVRIEILEQYYEQVDFSIFLEDDRDWIEPLYDKKNKSIVCEEENNKKCNNYDRYVFLWEDKTEFKGNLRRDK